MTSVGEASSIARPAGAADGARAYGLHVEVQAEGTLLLHLSGEWKVHHGLPQIAPIEAEIEKAGSIRTIAFESGELVAWDSALVRFLMSLDELARKRKITFDGAGLPTGARRLVELALAVPEVAGAGRTVKRVPFVARIGKATLDQLKGTRDVVTFFGDVTLMFGRFFRGKANYRRSDLFLTIQECGAQALPIVTIISLLVGLILAFVGAIQLRQFGAQIFVADLVGVAMAREMGAIMTGIVLAGRTGAAFAANIGTMQGNEEIDALTTLGISPVDFLVLPRMLALLLMMPLLVIYADFMGMLGGWIVGVGMLKLTSAAYVLESRHGVDLLDFALGIFKGAVFGAIVAIAGCLRGMQAGRSSAAVGDAATSAVVTGIVFIIVTDALFAVLTNILNI